MIGYIYKTTNIITGKIYIGQHMSSSFDIKYKGSGISLSYAIKKYGWDNFYTEIIEECESLSQMNEREGYWIAYYNSTDKSIGYNLDSGGSNNKHSESTKAKMSKSALGKKKSPTHCQNISRAKTGTTHDSWQLGKVWMFKENESHLVTEEDINYYLSIGFSFGRPKQAPYCPNLRERTYITDGISDKNVLNTELEKYLNNGWVVGRKPYTKERNNNISAGKAGKIRVVKDTTIKYVSLNDLSKYLNDGYDCLNKYKDMVKRNTL